MFGLATSKVQLGLLAAWLVSTCVLGGLYWVSLADVRALEAEKTSLQAQLAAVGKDLTAQNTAVDALKKASDAQARAARRAQEAAQRALGAANARAEALAHADVPATCPDALEWLRDQVSAAERARGDE